MTVRERALTGLLACIPISAEDKKIGCANCPYGCSKADAVRLPIQMIEDIREVLKAQEPVEPKWRNGYAYCGQCGYKLHWIVDQNNFCPNCGRAVKWK